MKMEDKEFGDERLERGTRQDLQGIWCPQLEYNNHEEVLKHHDRMEARRREDNCDGRMRLKEGRWW